MKPPLNYFGGKIALAERIVDLLPVHRHYVEPFAGSLAVLLAKPPVHMETVNDIDQELMTFWRMLREQPAELIRVCSLTPHSRAEEAAAYDSDTVTELECARRVWVKLTQGRTGTLKRSGWHYCQDPAGLNSSVPERLASFVRRLEPVAQRLQRVTLECRDAMDVIADYGRHREVLIYVDPPYLSSTRPASPTNYSHEAGTEAAHRGIAAALHACAASVVVSGYDSPLYEVLYAGWDSVRFQTSTRRGGRLSPRVEVLWSNRELEATTLFSNGAAGYGWPE